MTLEEALLADLTGNAAAVVAIAGTRGYPELIPAGVEMPAWAYQTISANREPAHDGPTGMTEQVIQITCQAATYGEAKALARAIRARWHGFRGTRGVQVFRAVVDNDQDGLADEDGATVRVDISVFYAEE